MNIQRLIDHVLTRAAAIYDQVALDALSEALMRALQAPEPKTQVVKRYTHKGVGIISVAEMSMSERTALIKDEHFIDELLADIDDLLIYSYAYEIWKQKRNETVRYYD